ncbi:MAG: hypothetical protein JW940_37690 [Polyangiaceae bacterium]|nr:hypothetical protein [Polyangiaceae bacterium]
MRLAGHAPYYLPPYPDLYAGVGVTLNDDSILFDACGYTDVEVEYASDQSVRLYAKWNDVDIYGDRDYVLLPYTSGIETVTVPLSSFYGFDCSKMTELQFEPSYLPGFGIAVYSVRFKDSSAECAEAAMRCTPQGDLEVCAGGVWVASACDEGQVCASNHCVDEDATPVDIHGHLSVSGTRLLDEYGVPVQLKGISSQWLNYETDGYATNADAMVWMRDHWARELRGRSAVKRVGALRPRRYRASRSSTRPTNGLFTWLRSP